MKISAMKFLVRALLVALMLVYCSGCAIGLGKSVHQYGQLDFTKVEDEKGSKEEIESIGSQYVFLYFTFTTDYAKEAYDGLLGKCVDGKIVNVSARHSTDLGILAYRNKIILKGTCIHSAAVATAVKRS